MGFACGGNYLISVHITEIIPVWFSPEQGGSVPIKSTAQGGCQAESSPASVTLNAKGHAKTQWTLSFATEHTAQHQQTKVAPTLF